jgi:hypothetical protein
MLGYINDQLHHKCHLMTLSVQLRLLISWHEYVSDYYEMYAYVIQWSTS